MEKHKSIVNKLLFDRFLEKKGIDMYTHFCVGVGIEDFISTAYFLCPDFLEVDNCILFYDTYAQTRNIEQLVKNTKERNNNDKKETERWINAISIGEFFSNQYSELLDDEYMLKKVYEVIEYFWRRRLKELFPNKEFEFECENELMGELGMAISFYEKI